MPPHRSAPTTRFGNRSWDRSSDLVENKRHSGFVLDVPTPRARQVPAWDLAIFHFQYSTANFLFSSFQFSPFRLLCTGMNRGTRHARCLRDQGYAAEGQRFGLRLCPRSSSMLHIVRHPSWMARSCFPSMQENATYRRTVQVIYPRILGGGLGAYRQSLHSV